MASCIVRHTLCIVLGVIITLGAVVEPSVVRRSSQLKTNFIHVRQITACVNDTSCYPADLNGSVVPVEYIQCKSSQCVCNNCFSLNGTICGYSTCGWYNMSTNTCISASSAKEQKTAFILSALLSSTGAANFYIGRSELGAAQLAVSLSTVIFTVAVLLFFCCGCLKSPFGGREFIVLNLEGILGSLFMCSSLTCIIVPGALITLIWWIVDMVMFANNERLDGNGCPLVANL